MFNLQYFTHQLINSKYTLLINLFIIFVFYSLFYGTKLIYCMNDNPDPICTPVVAEAKEIHRPSQQLLAIKREIMTYAGAQTNFIERLDEQTRVIEDQKTTISDMQNEIVSLRKKLERNKLLEQEINELNYLKRDLEAQKNSINSDIDTIKRAITWVEEDLVRMDDSFKQTDTQIRRARERFWNESDTR